MALIGASGRQGEEWLVVLDQEEQVIDIATAPGPQPPALSTSSFFGSRDSPDGDATG